MNFMSIPDLVGAMEGEHSPEVGNTKVLHFVKSIILANFKDLFLSLLERNLPSSKDENQSILLPQTLGLSESHV